MDLGNVFMVFAVRPSETGPELHRKILGKFILHDGNFEVLEDHGLPEGLEGATPEEGARIVHRLANSMYTEVVSVADIVEGKRPDLISSPESVASLAAANAKPDYGEFEYHRVGSPAPQIVHVSGGSVYLDGHGLSPDESQRIMQHVKTGQATLKRRLNKAESIDPNNEHQTSDPRLSQQLNEDTLVKGVGNKSAYKKFVGSAPQGVHVMMNMNDFGQLSRPPNNVDTGNKAIQAVGKQLLDALHESVGKNQSVAHRVGGDLFHVHVPTAEHAASFLRAFRAKLESIPSIMGSHVLSASAGYGYTPDSATTALAQAKYMKTQTPHIPGRSGFVVKSHDELG